MRTKIFITTNIVISFFIISYIFLFPTIEKEKKEYYIEINEPYLIYEYDTLFGVLFLCKINYFIIVLNFLIILYNKYKKKMKLNFVSLIILIFNLILTISRNIYLYPYYVYWQQHPMYN